MKKLNRAFGNTPPEIGYAIEAAFARGEIKMKRRHKWKLALTAAACLAAFLAAAFAVSDPARTTPDNIVTAPVSEDAVERVFYTEQGSYYHGYDNCQGMAGAAEHTLAEAVDAGKRRCPVCQPGEAPEHYDLFQAALGMAFDDLYPGYTYRYTNGTYWVLGRPSGDETTERSVYCEASEHGAVLTIDLSPEGTWERLLNLAINPVAAMCGADYAAIAEANGQDFPGLDAARGEELTLTYDEAGDLTALLLVLDSDATIYNCFWEKNGNGFDLRRVEVYGLDDSADAPDGHVRWELPEGRFTVEG